MELLIDFNKKMGILSGKKISLIASALLATTTISNASVTGATVTSGSATVAQNGAITNINQSTNKASINWQSFSIGANEVVNFNQPSSSSITLNRVVGNEKSIIDGALNANGQVWILNSSGVLFGKNASINTSGLLATTANLSDQDFNAGNYNFTNANSNSIINQGTIEVANSGSVILASKEVVNEGKIKAIKGKIHLVGADSYSINLNNNSLANIKVDKGVLDAMVKNSGTIIADGGEIYLTTNAVDELFKSLVQNTGIIEANSIDGLSGKVEIFAHGGTAQVGGSIIAEGTGSQNGGFIETSGEIIDIADDFYISTLSQNGKTGTWLIDPADITIENGGTDAITGSSIDASTVETSLATTSVVLEATNDITISESINSNTANSLTFKAGRDITQSANIDIQTNGGDVIFWADSDANSEGRIVINNSSSIQTNGGKIALSGGADDGSNGGTIGDGIADGVASGYSGSNMGVWLYGNSGNTINLSSGGGDIIIKGQSSSTNVSANQNGILIRYTTISSGAGDIDMLGTSLGQGTLTQGILLSSDTSINTTTGDVTIKGTGSSNGSNKYWGVRLYNGASITSGGDLSLTGIAGASSYEGISQDSGSITVAGTTTLNTGSYDLDLSSTTNNFTGTVSITQAKDISLIDSSILKLGAITATGAVDIATLAGDMTLAGNISGTSIILNAGKNTSSGTTTGGNIIISGTPTITASSGNAKLYSGSISGSTGLATLIGSGSGNFRYNSDETTTNYTTALGTTGNYAIYREQPTITITATNDTKTYDGLAYTSGNGVTYSGLVNGDTSSLLGGTLAYSGTSQNAINAGTYVITPSGLTNSLGYTLSYTNGALTINKADATVTANSKTVRYNGKPHSLSGFSATGLVNGETISVLSGVSGDSIKETDVGTYSTSLSGSDENYNLTFVDGKLTINEALVTTKKVTNLVAISNINSTIFPISEQNSLKMSLNAKYASLKSSSKLSTGSALNPMDMTGTEYDRALIPPEPIKVNPNARVVNINNKSSIGQMSTIANSNQIENLAQNANQNSPGSGKEMLKSLNKAQNSVDIDITGQSQFSTLLSNISTINNQSSGLNNLQQLSTVSLSQNQQWQGIKQIIIPGTTSLSISGTNSIRGIK
jgi:filamentous hemagglutinin family protein